MKRSFALIVVTVVGMSGANAQVTLNGCGLAGDGTNALQRLLNPLKNRFTIPDKLNSKITLEALLRPGEDSTRFLNGDAAALTGFVVKEKLGGVESCNCHSGDPRFMDRHIYIGKSAKAELKDCVIIEVTPRFYAKHRDWIQINLLPGHIVRFEGWMFFDAEHKSNAVNTSPQNTKDWRATCWELHPVTDIKVIQ